MLMPDLQTIHKDRHIVFLSFAFNKTYVHLLASLSQSNLNIWLSKVNETICRFTVKHVVGNFAESAPY